MKVLPSEGQTEWKGLRNKAAQDHSYCILSDKCWSSVYKSQENKVHKFNQLEQNSHQINKSPVTNG